MLVEHTSRALSESSLGDGAVEEVDDEAVFGSKARLMTYSQVFLRPAVNTRSRDWKELHLLARALDLIPGGSLAEATDLLAARFKAVEEAARSDHLGSSSLAQDRPPGAQRAQLCFWQPRGMAAWWRKQVALDLGAHLC